MYRIPPEQLSPRNPRGWKNRMAAANYRQQSMGDMAWRNAVRSAHMRKLQIDRLLEEGKIEPALHAEQSAALTKALGTSEEAYYATDTVSETLQASLRAADVVLEQAKHPVDPEPVAAEAVEAKPVVAKPAKNEAPKFRARQDSFIPSPSLDD